MEFEWSQKDKEFLTETWGKIKDKLRVTSRRIGTSIPYIAKNNKYSDVGNENITWWTNGFWGGILWQMYNATQEERYLKLAGEIENKLDQAFDSFQMLDHDVGFMWLNTAVLDYKITGDKKSFDRSLRATEILAARYDPIGEYLLAWNGEERKGQIIVDCFMNLSLLYWASKVTGDSRFKEMAIKHTQTATKNLIRGDGTVNHIAVFDQETGDFIKNLGGQGYGEGSAWSRGQAWAIYGMTIAYRETQNIEYLNKAKLVANNFIANICTTNFISAIDFRVPEDEPDYIDTTATAITICALMNLIEFLPKVEQAVYKRVAIKMFRSITNNYVDFNKNNDEILASGSAKYHREEDREVPIIYGDAFYLEALLRFINLDLKIY